MAAAAFLGGGDPDSYSFVLVQLRQKYGKRTAKAATIIERLSNAHQSIMLIRLHFFALFIPKIYLFTQSNVKKFTISNFYFIKICIFPKFLVPLQRYLKIHILKKTRILR